MIFKYVNQEKKLNKISKKDFQLILDLIKADFIVYTLELFIKFFRKTLNFI